MTRIIGLLVTFTAIAIQLLVTHPAMAAQFRYRSQGVEAASPGAACILGGTNHDSSYGSPGCHNWSASSPTVCHFEPNNCGGAGDFLIERFCPAGEVCEEPPEEPGDPKCDGEGNPIGRATGNKFQREIDYASPGLNKLTFTRYYNSQGMQVSYQLSSLNWRSEYESRINTLNQATRAELIRPDGGKLYFDKIGDSWKSADGETVKLSQVSVSGNAFWQVQQSDGGIEYYHIVAANQLGNGSPADDIDGRLAKLVSSNKYERSIAYINLSGKYFISSVIDSYGRTLTFSYDFSQSNAYPELTLTTPGGATYRYKTTGSDGGPRLSAVLYPDEDSDPDNNPKRQYHYENPDFPYALTGITDANGDRLATWTYDEKGLAVESYHGEALEPENRIDYVDIQRNADDTVSVFNSYGKETKFTYVNLNGESKLVQIDGIASANCIADVSGFTYYSGTGWTKTRTDKNGNVTEYEYYTDNARYGKLKKKTEAKNDPNGAERVYVYDWYANGQKKSERLEGKLETIYTYTAEGHPEIIAETDLTSIQLPYLTNGRTRSSQYSYAFWDSSHSQIKSISLNGPRTDVSDTYLFEYSIEGYLTKTTDALGHATEVIERWPSGLPKKTIDANGQLSETTFSARGWLLKISVYSQANTNAATRVTNFSYDGEGQLARVERTLANNQTYSIYYHYDDGHRLYKVDDSEGNYIQYTLDVAGKIIAKEIRDNQGQIKYQASYLYDELGRLLVTRDAAGNAIASYAYDANDNQRFITLGGDSSTEIEKHYDALNRVNQIDHADGFNSQYQYENDSNLKKVADQRGLETQYVYDGFGLLIQMVSPDTGSTTNWYDAAGNVIKTIDERGVESQYVYDALNRMIQIIYPSTPEENVIYGFDSVSNGNAGIGRLTSIQKISSAIQYQYDVFGNLVHRAYAIGDTAYKIQYKYDNSGNHTATVFPSGRRVHYNYGSNGKLISVTTEDWLHAQALTLANHITYMPFGPIKGWEMGNGLVHSVGYDENYAIARISTGNVYDRTLSYFQTGNLERILDNTSSSASTFLYDASGRVTTSTRADDVVEYQYDGVGNRLSRKVLNGSTLVREELLSYPFDSNRLSSIVANTSAPASMQYNAIGQLTLDARSGTVFYYNAAGRMIRASNSNNDVGYSYNALGQRIAKASNSPNSENIHYHYDEDGQLIAETNQYGVPVREYVYLGNQLLAMLMPSASDDADSDGMNDAWEIQYFGNTNRNGSQDADGDGVSDVSEFRTGGLPGDVDQDGMSDAWEIQYFGNLEQDSSTDFDGNGLLDADEFIEGTDPVKDHDDDGMLDSWELLHFGDLDQTALTDADNDGLLDKVEFILGLDPMDGVVDSDADGMPDSWEYSYFDSLQQNGATNFDGDDKKDVDEFRNGTDPTVAVFYNRLDPVKTHASIVLSNNNTTASTTAGGWLSSVAKASLPSGKKYYWEAEIATGNYVLIGIGSDVPLYNYVGSTSGSYGWFSYPGGPTINAAIQTAFLSYVPGNQLMFAFDPNSGKLWFGLNGVWQGNPELGTGARFSGITGTQYPAVSVYGAGKATFVFDPSQFKYSIPTGFSASEIVQ